MDPVETAVLLFMGTFAAVALVPGLVRRLVEEFRDGRVAALQRYLRLADAEIGELRVRVADAANASKRLAVDVASALDRAGRAESAFAEVSRDRDAIRKSLSDYQQRAEHERATSLAPAAIAKAQNERDQARACYEACQRQLADAESRVRAGLSREAKLKDERDRAIRLAAPTILDPAIGMVAPWISYQVKPGDVLRTNGDGSVYWAPPE